jgi:hypothetical protein
MIACFFRVCFRGNNTSQSLGVAAFVAINS